MHTRALFFSFAPTRRSHFSHSLLIRPKNTFVFLRQDHPHIFSTALFHTSIKNYTRDANTYDKDKYDWTELEKEVFKDFGFGEKKIEYQTVIPPINNIFFEY
jgi:hypothetical protein